jgi:hypothetical protein
MDRREMLGMIGAGSAGLLAFAGEASAAQSAHRMDKGHEECFKACADCAKTCEMMFHHCFKLVVEGHKDHARSARAALDCAEFCGLSAKLIARMSPMMVYSCEGCAKACKKCGDECAKFDTPEMKECAEVCRKCEQSCREMVKSMQA